MVFMKVSFIYLNPMLFITQLSKPRVTQVLLYDLNFTLVLKYYLIT